MVKGYVNLVLHAHLPFIYTAKHPHNLEERWFFEALTESYLPLLMAFDRLEADGVPYALTLSLSPTLLAMLDHPVLSSRYRDYLSRVIRLARQETVRTRGDEDFHRLATFYLERYEMLDAAYSNHYQGDLTSAFARLSKAGHLELITTCATHGYLPLMKTREAVKTQIGIGLDSFAARFGFYPKGMWLPECGYFPGLDEILAEKGVGYIFLDAHGVQHTYPPPQNSVYAPIQSKANVAVFARDPETSAQVWSMDAGYPGDKKYREYYRDIGFVLDENYIRQYLPYPVQVSTGLKYWQITGQGLPKAPYQPQQALAKSHSHADNFHFNREQQIHFLAEKCNVPPVITAPYDAELFGHWWFEGPDFLEKVFHNATASQVYAFSTPSRYLAVHGCAQESEIFHSSWGEGGYSRVWLNPSNDWIYQQVHRAESMLLHQSSLHQTPTPEEARVLSQLNRELLLAQSSDWAFMLNAGTTDEYARTRLTSHLDNFQRLSGMLTEGRVEAAALVEMETDVSGLFPRIRTEGNAAKMSQREVTDASKDPSVLMFSWEYPPLIMGGLARHVDDLSQALAEQGQEVSVLTSRAGDAPAFSVNHQVCAYRVAPYQIAGEDINFHDWVLQLNMVFLNLAQQIIPAQPFAILHAHDWLVGAASLGIKRYWRLPLVATIHATEHGRNGGIFTQLQKKIHEQERELVEQADRVICCSNYMAEEISELFQILPKKITVIENGVMPDKVKSSPLKNRDRRRYARDNEAILYFVGRLVREKGLETLLQALPQILATFPATKLVISGQGPMLASLQELAQTLGIVQHVVFTGFINDRERNTLLATADAAVFPSHYEPFGIVALEAMAAGIPVVAADVGGMGEVIEHGKDGLKFPPGDAQALATAIGHLLADQALRDRLAKAGQQKAITTYSWQSLAEKTAQLYREVWEESL